MTGWHSTTRQARGYGAGWQRVRIQALKRDTYLCQPCKRKGRTTAATQVDHVKPKAKGGTDDLDNLQSICGPCHQRKTAEDEGREYRLKRQISKDGWPVED